LSRVGLGNHQAKRPGALSGGQRQRVALARTLMEDRPVVLLDEPFSALDTKTRAEMQDMACEVLKGRTVLMVTHDPAEAARLGHQITIMETGGLAPVTPPPGPAPRPVDDPATLQTQAALLTRLRNSAA
jgi:putative hydroxymethylpyrimidine transport system ATP-binding protein